MPARRRALSYGNCPLVIEQNNATGGVSLWQRNDNQSVADRNGISLADYIHAMYGFLRQAKARRVLMIGCGGGTLATMLHRAGVHVTLIDIDALSFAVAALYFHLPDEIERHVGDGVRYLRRHRERYDAIVLDAYVDTRIPRQFLEPSFFRLAKSRLKAQGAIFLVNILTANDDDRTPDRIARLMRRTWRQVRLLDADGWEDRNAVGLAGAVAQLRRPRLLLRPERRAKSIARNLRELDFRALRA
jgi:SAM-dependent methyltransferase